MRHIFRAAALAVGAVALGIPLIMWTTGAQAMVVGGGSMRPALERGAIVLVVPTAPQRVALGDVIVYRPDDASRRPVVHRVTTIYTDTMSGELRYRTRGDANDVLDAAPVRPDQLVGAMRGAVPYAGEALYAMRQPRGYVLALGPLLILMLALEARELRRTLRREGATS